MTRQSTGMRSSSKVAFAFAWLVYGVTVMLAWRKVLAVPDARGDVSGLLVATVAGFLGLALLAAWLSDHESRDRPPGAAERLPGEPPPPGVRRPRAGRAVAQAARQSAKRTGSVPGPRGR